MSFWKSEATEEYKKTNIYILHYVQDDNQKKSRSVGIEPTAHGFGDHCSTDELRPYPAW